MSRRAYSRGRPRHWRGLAAIGLVVLAGVSAVMAREEVQHGTYAVFTDSDAVGGTVGTARVFRATRSTVDFSLSDVSSGSAVDASAATAFADGTYFLTRTWTSSFSGSRYIEVDFNAPLPGAIAVTSPQLTVRAASNSAGGTACYYAELRYISTGALISSIGSSGSPAACIAGTTLSSSSFSLSGFGSTDIGNDARIRIYGRDSSGAAIRLDAVTITGTTSYMSFTLYPLLTRELYDGNTEVIKWGLAAR
jgi:hypothetical protein